MIITSLAVSGSATSLMVIHVKYICFRARGVQVTPLKMKMLCKMVQSIFCFLEISSVEKKYIMSFQTALLIRYPM